MTISRRNLMLLAGFLLAAALYLAWSRHGWDYVNLPPSASGPWIAFGDSLTEGYGASSGADYPAQLSQRLGIPIQNLGAAGETSEQGLQRLPQVEALRPRVVLLCFGGNDVLQGRSRASMIGNVGTMIDRFHADGSFVVLIGVRGASLVGDRNAGVFKDLAREKKVLLVPNILDEVFSTPALMSDYVHPNDAGYAHIAERLEKTLHPFLHRLR